MQITRESLLQAGYIEFRSEHLNYEDGKLLTFGIIPKIDMYYQTDLMYCRLVTGSEYHRGNKTIFDGRVETMEDLAVVVKCCTYFALNPIV